MLSSWVPLFAMAFAISTIVAQPQSSRPACQRHGDNVPVSELPEASGIAASRRTPGVFWAHNDSGKPIVYALDTNGAVIGRVLITGARVEDWEDIAVGPCAHGSCLYVADIGDNDGARSTIALYRVPEPMPQDRATPQADVFGATYPDEAHDAEALFVTSPSDAYIVTKGDPGPVALYRWPLESGRTTTLARVGAPLAEEDVRPGDRPTAADISPEGGWVAVRTTQHVAFYRAAELIVGRWREASRVDLRPLGERRGEGVTFDRSGLVLVSEGGGGGRPGTFARLACTFPR